MKNDLLPGENELFATDRPITANNYRAFPEAYKPKPKKKKQSPANALTDAVISLIKLLGGIAYRINSMGVYDKSFEGYRMANTKKGLPDIIGLLNGRFISVEIKASKGDKLSEHQIKENKKLNHAVACITNVETLKILKTGSL